MIAARRVLSSIAWLALAIAAADLIARPLARTNLIGVPGLEYPGLSGAIALIAGLALIALARGPRYRVFTVFALLFALGLYGQVRVGARLLGDGFYYYAYLRSLAFDRDVNFLNDYPMIGLGDKPHLFMLTSTGHAQSAWTIGPAIVWSPFYAGAHILAKELTKTRANVSVDGASYPYRQAICIAGLFYGLLGAYFIWRLCLLFAPARAATAATALAISGSFMAWYIVRDPTATHAPAMASTAAFAWLWVATLWKRTTRQWIALGAIGGLMADIRWQSAIYGLLPLIEVGVLAWHASRRGDYAALRRLGLDAAVGGTAFVVGFLPQMLAWKAIYGSYLAVSPVGPAIRFNDPHWADVIWSSRNGLFSNSPILIVAALGLWLLSRRDRTIAVAFALSCVVMVVFNSMIQDWWGSSAFGARRFDGAIPLLAVGLALVIDAGARVIAARPMLPAAAVLAGAVAWNGSFASAMRGDGFDTRAQNDFAGVLGAQWRSVHARFGFPFSWPVNLLFAWRNGVSPALYDQLSPNSLFNDPVVPLGQIDFGGARDEVFLVSGWSGGAIDGATTFRQTARIAEVYLPLARTPALRFRLRVRAARPDGAPQQHVSIAINGRAFGMYDLDSQWEAIEFDVPAEVLHTTVNRVVLTATYGSDDVPPGGMNDPAFRPSLEVDLLRVDRADAR